MKSLPASALLALALVVTALSFGYITFKSTETSPLTIAPQTQTAQVGSSLPSGLVAYLPFDNSTADSSGSGNNGSWSGSASYGAGKIGSGSASFTGSNYVTINSQVYPLAGGTVAFWFKANSGTLTGSYGGSGNQRAPTFNISSAGNLKWEFSDFSDAGNDTGVRVTDGQWHHAAMTYTANQAKIYVDGALVGTDDVPAPGDFFNQVHIGHYGNYGSLFANGLIDDFRIYNRELSASEISAIRAYTGAPAGDTSAPVISGVAVSNVSTSEVRISWTTNEPADTYVNFGLTSSYGNSSALKDTGAGMVTSHAQSIVSLQPNTTYNYRVTSKDAAGNSASSANATFTTSAPANVAPTVTLAPISSTTVTPATVTLSATASDSDGTISRVEFYNGATLLGSDASAPYTYTWTGVALGIYNISAKAIDNAGASATSNVQVASVTGCPPGTALSGTSCIPSSTTFSIGSRVQTYNTNTINVRQIPDGTILGTQSAGIAGTVIAGPSYVGGLWWWQINYDSGVDGWSVENFLKTATIVTPPVGDTTAPSIPSGLTATAVSSSQINLTWNASTDNTAVTGYKVYRGGVQIANITPAATTFQNTSGLTAATAYSYTVSAYDAAGNSSAQSAAASATTLSVTPTSYSVTVTKSGTGTGTVTSTGSINCGTTCTANGTPGQTVTLTATPATGSTFTGWTGSCTGTSTTCSFTLNANATVGAGFAVVAATTYTITSSAGANGSITSTGTVVLGGSKTFSIVPNSGYQVASVLVDGASVGAVSTYTFSNVTSNHSISAAFSIIPISAGTTLYVTPSGAGANTGADWNNAYAKLPATLIRGATYVIAGGSYGGYAFDDIEDGAKVITIRKASSAAGYRDDLVAGWTPSYETSQAVFTNSSISRGYYTIDGITPTGRWSKAAGDYGIKITYANPNVTNHLLVYANSGVSAHSYVNLKHIAFVNAGKSYDKEQMALWGQGGPATDFVISHSLFQNNQQPVRLAHSGIRNFTLEYNYFDTNWSTSLNHGEQFGIWYGSGDHTIRYNYFNGYTGTGNVMAGGDGNYENNMQIYGNVFYNMGIYDGANNGTFGTMDSGQSSHLDGWKIYNNTFVNGTINLSRPALGSASGWDVRNNLFYNATAGVFNLQPSGTYDYNYRNGGGWGWTVGSHDVSSVEAQSSLFPNFSSGNYSLGSGSKAVNAGVALPAPYNVDANGVVRGADGAWDVGAFEYVGSVTPPVDPNPILYSVTVTKSGTGSGTVTSAGSINCGTTCSSVGDPGMTVTLTATPAAGSTFTGWTGVTGCSTATVCSFTLNSNTTVNAAFITTVASDTTAPSIPSGLTATAVSSSQINLSWNASTDNTAVTGYKVYRGGVQIANITPAATTFQNTSGLTAATAYSYTVSAYDAAGNSSAQSAAASATTQTATIPSGTTVNVTPSTWTNLTFVRGTTYVLAPGTYSGKTLSTPASGTQLITIKGSGTGQVVFTGGFTFASSYWVIDGVTGSMSTNPADYGFKFADGVTHAGFISAVGGTFTDITMSHIAAKAPTGDVEKPYFRMYTQVNQVNNVTISNSLLDGYQSVVWSAGQGSAINNNWLVERNILLNGFSSGAHHGEWIDVDGKQITNLVVRYNIFKGSNGGMTGSIVANNVNLSGAIVYGNVFDSVSVGNGIITGTSVGKLINAQVYNNTFLNSSPGGGWVSGGQSGGTGNIAKNNIIYNMSSSVGQGVTASSNDTPTANPFTTVSGYGAASIYGLATQTAAADTTVPAQYRTDMNGKTGSSRGAIQF